jgi:hypothetical protein
MKTMLKELKSEVYSRQAMHEEERAHSIVSWPPVSQMIWRPLSPLTPSLTLLLLGMFFQIFSKVIKRALSAATEGVDQYLLYLLDCANIEADSLQQAQFTNS